MKASSIVAPKKQSKEKPDLEEALEESDEGEVVDEQEGAKDEAGRDVDEEDVDLSSVLNGHMELQAKMGDVLRVMGGDA